MKHYVRILSGESIDDGRNEACGNGDRGANAYFPRRGVSEEFDVLHGLPQFVERDEAALEQCTPVNCGLDTLWATVEETNTERVFHVGDRLRYRRLRHRELRGSLSHAAAPSRGKQHIQIPQLEVTAETLLIPVHGFAHEEKLWAHRVLLLRDYGAIG